MESFFKKRGSPHTLQGRHYAIVPLENHVRKCIKTINILEFAKVGIEGWEVSGMRYYVRIGMLSLQYKLLWAIHHVSRILCQISKHLQDVLLTKLLGQFIEVHENQFFQRLKNLIWDSITIFFLQHFEKLGLNEWTFDYYRGRS